jgi:adenylate cyclase
MNQSEIRAIIDWLIDGARSAPQPEEVLAQLSDRLVAAGVPLWRVAVFVRTLHPQIMGRRLLWQHGAAVDIRNASYDLLDSGAFRESSVIHVYNTRQPLRRLLADPDCPIDMLPLAEMRAEGATDYVAAPLVFTNGEVHVITCATMQPGGFTAEEFAALEAIFPPLARVAEIRALRRTAAVLLDTYVGNQAGERILSGNIRRGAAQAIDAAIWLSDMRGSTALADRLHPETFFDLLNNYFDCQVPAIVAQGGEVLKFMGDGLLAIFPTGDGERGYPECCRRALDAALTADRAIGKLPPVDGEPVRFGLALHLGHVLHGNIGSGNRLDFTCIGPAVHLAARIEKLAGERGQTILASEEFARYCGDRLRPVGAFRLAGFAAEQRLFRPLE